MHMRYRPTLHCTSYLYSHGAGYMSLFHSRASSATDRLFNNLNQIFVYDDKATIGDFRCVFSHMANVICDFER